MYEKKKYFCKRKFQIIEWTESFRIKVDCQKDLFILKTALRLLISLQQMFKKLKNSHWSCQDSNLQNMQSYSFKKKLKTVWQITKTSRN